MNGENYLSNIFLTYDRDKCNFRSFSYQRIIFIRECKWRNISQLHTARQAMAFDPTRLSSISHHLHIHKRGCFNIINRGVFTLDIHLGSRGLITRPSQI